MPYQVARLTLDPPRLNIDFPLRIPIIPNHLPLTFPTSWSTAPPHETLVPVCSIFSQSSTFGLWPPLSLPLLCPSSLSLIHKSLVSTNTWPGPAQILPPKSYAAYVCSYPAHIISFLQTLTPLYCFCHLFWYFYHQ